MGASGWYYFVPYQEDIALVLALLHRRIFAEEDYFDTWLSDHILYKYWNDLNELWEEFRRFWIEADGRERIWEGFMQAGLKELARVLAAKQIDVALPEPPTIEELLRCYGTQGMHNILDIMGVAEQPGLYMATPLTREEHLTFFGTEKPTRARLEAALAWDWRPGRSLYDIRRRWQAVYFTVYKDDRPDDLCFCEHSGD
ncbi:MAG TPA: hypothetical protein VNG51_21585 [Ktedonobacteraceae bacterium]|nr:hypothetical protein [Ktedonobacteraceae bacterium]